ncbi:hypothetical protein CEQ90_05800 [Lewinellaceae bacterium SD302]|nr:hypothetical protein CEQ90_05800 [Lewinellaceae bacterium SD302]
MTFKILSATLILFAFNACILRSKAKMEKFPLFINEGRLNTTWQVDSHLKANVFLESGFPEIIFDNDLADALLSSNSKLVRTASEASVNTWGTTENLPVVYKISGEMNLYGNLRQINALVVDLSEHEVWAGYDIIFPIRSFNVPTAINFADSLIEIGDGVIDNLISYEKYEADFDKEVNGLFAVLSLVVYDSLNVADTISGNFLFDLGASNAVYLNREKREVEFFLKKTKRMHLDSSRFTALPAQRMAIIMPEKFKLGSIDVEDQFIVVMDMGSENSSQQYIGAIGNSLLKDRRIVFDFNREEVYLKVIR